MPIGGVRVEGHTIVSADGMIADAAGRMPPELHNEADWRLFQAALDEAALVVIGRLGHERHPNRGRRRLVLTHRVAALAADADDKLATFWNPAGLAIADALDRLGVRSGMLAITGGTDTMELFLPLFDAFLLTEVAGLQLPGGTPCFRNASPHAALAGAGLSPDPPLMIHAGVSRTLWRRG